MMETTHQEKVLPSGAFARLPCALKGSHWVAAQAEANAKQQDIVWTILAQNLTLDGEPVTYQQLMDSDLRDAMAINQMLNAILLGPIK